MQRIILSGLSVLLISAINTSAVQAEVTAVNQNLTPNIALVEPFNLVFLAYQGYFTKQGIPSNGAFLSALHGQKINAKSLVQSAIEAGKLPQETINNSSYISSVDSLLRNFHL